MGRYVSFVVRSWQDSADGTMRWQVSYADEQEPLLLPTGSFIIRTWIDDDETVRGIVRHVQSGEQVLFQSSRRALEFIQAWIGGVSAPCCTDSSDWNSIESGKVDTNG